MASIQQIVNEQFLDRVAALEKGEKRYGAAQSKALSGTDPESRISISVRAGSKMYARALTGINFGVSVLNFAHSDLERIHKLTGEIITLVENAASPNSSRESSPAYRPHRKKQIFLLTFGGVLHSCEQLENFRTIQELVMAV